MKEYLSATEFIDIHHSLIQKKAAELALNIKNKEEIAKRCFEFVRDEIKHSWDYQLNPITCKASEVLFYGTGYCYAKSHLLAALLRANNIPAALCYQRLTISDDQPPFCLHGLNAIYLENYGWYKVDARGNKEGINAQFTPPLEQLAFTLQSPGEMDIEGLFSHPLKNVIQALTHHHTYIEMANNLPDVKPN